MGTLTILTFIAAAAIVFISGATSLPQNVRYGRPQVIYPSPVIIHPTPVVIPPGRPGYGGVSQLSHGGGNWHGGRPGFGTSSSSASASSSSSSFGGAFGQSSSSSSATANSFRGRGYRQINNQAQSESGTINFGPLVATFSKSQSNANAQSVSSH